MKDQIVRIGGWDFDHASYDESADVLYLSMGEPRSGYGEESPEGHILRFDDDGNFYGLTLIGIREELDAAGVVSVTVPSPATAETFDRTDLDRVLEPA